MTKLTSKASELLAKMTPEMAIEILAAKKAATGIKSYVKLLNENLSKYKDERQALINIVAFNNGAINKSRTEKVQFIALNVEDIKTYAKDLDDMSVLNASEELQVGDIVTFEDSVEGIKKDEIQKFEFAGSNDYLKGTDSKGQKFSYKVGNVTTVLQGRKVIAYRLTPSKLVKEEAVKEPKKDSK